MTIIAFSDWLQEILDKREWKPKTLADKAHLDPSIVSRAINRERMPSNDSLKAIADALELPIETVFRAAGLLPDLPTLDDAQLEIINYKARELTQEQRDDLIFYIEFIQAKGPPPGQKQPQPAPRKRRQGSSPGEVVKDES